MPSTIFFRNFPFSNMVMDKRKLIKKISAYIAVSHAWHAANEPDIIPDSLGTEMIDLEEEILSELGLPPMAYQFSSVMQEYGYSVDNLQEKSAELLYKLEQQVPLYKSMLQKPKCQILHEGKEQRLDAQEVLPILDFPVTRYTRFLYHDIFCKGKCDAGLLISYLSLKMEVYDDDRLPDITPFLNEYRDYLENIEAESYWEKISIKTASADFEEAYPVETELKLTTFIISSFEVRSEAFCAADIIIKHRHSYLMLKLYMIVEQLQLLLLKARYVCDISPLILNIRDGRPYKYNEEDNRADYIEVPVIKLKIERVDELGDEIMHPYSFLISTIR